MSELLPVNYSAAHAAATLGDGDGHPPAPPTVDQLADWSQENYVLDVSVAATLGFPVGSLTASHQHQSLLFGVSRWVDLDTADGHVYRFGVALRALVTVTQIQGDGALTLPVVAAKVELERARASAQLLVRGDKGDALGGMLPQWQSFGVDSYAAYMQAVSDIQAKVMSDSANLAPQLLATTVVSPTLPPSAASVGMVYALEAIAHGATLTHALDRLRTDDDGVQAAVRATYQARVGSNERAQPDQDTRQAARDELRGTHLSQGLFDRR
jgi:hypothetical protein